MYFGPVADVSSYFASYLGIVMPQDTCTADFVIDELLKLEMQQDEHSLTSKEGSDEYVERRHDKTRDAHCSITITQEADAARKGTYRQTRANEWNEIFHDSTFGQSIMLQIQSESLSSKPLLHLSSQHSRKTESAFSAFTCFWSSVSVLCQVSEFSPLCN